VASAKTKRNQWRVIPLVALTLGTVASAYGQSAALDAAVRQHERAVQDATLTAGGELNLKAQEFNTKVVRGDGTSRTETKFETSNIEAGGTVVLSAKKDLTLEGSKVDAGNNLLVESKQGNVNLVALKETSDYSYNGQGALAEIQAKEKAAQANAAQDTTPQEQTFAAEIVNHTQVHEESLQNVRLSSKGNATVQANQGDIKATALDINAGQNITLKAGGLVQLGALQTNNSQVQDKQVLTGVSVDAETNTQTANYQNQTTRESSSQANGGTLKAGNDVTINGGHRQCRRGAQSGPECQGSHRRREGNSAN
jgi:hypothetical protein